MELKNELVLYCLITTITSLAFFLLGYMWKQEENIQKSNRPIKSLQQKSQFSVILTDQEFNTLLDETNCIE